MATEGMVRFRLAGVGLSNFRDTEDEGLQTELFPRSDERFMEANEVTKTGQAGLVEDHAFSFTVLDHAEVGKAEAEQSDGEDRGAGHDEGYGTCAEDADAGRDEGSAAGLQEAEQGRGTTGFAAKGSKAKGC